LFCHKIRRGGPTYWRELASHGGSIRTYLGGFFIDAEAERVPKDNNNTYEDRGPSTVFREFAAECTQLAKTAPTPDKRALYLRMASVWHSMAIRWEKKREAEGDWGSPHWIRSKNRTRLP
jgi:hypothetical protein